MAPLAALQGDLRVLCLPYRSLDEPRDRWRPLFRERVAPLAAGARSLTEAALQLNARVWGLWGISFKADSTPEVLSPFQAWLCMQTVAVRQCMSN